MSRNYYALLFMKKIPLTQGLFALVDDADFEKVNTFKWFAHRQRRRIYAHRNVKRGGGRSIDRMHSFIMPGIREIDHIDGNGLNNQRHNLRPCTRRQNQQSFRRKKAGASSLFRGVSWHSRGEKWQADIKVDGKGVYLGWFSEEIDAARAYDVASKKYFKGFASLNFPAGAQ